MYVELPFGEEPKRLFCSLDAGRFAVEHQVDSVDAELFCETDDFLSLSRGHAVGHDGEGWDAEIVEVDDVVEAFDEDQAVLRDEFTVAGFLQTARLLAKEPDTVLSARELEVLQLTAQGLTAREVGKSLSISSNTVERHRANIMSKLGVSNRAELIRYAIRRGLLAIEDL